MLEYNKDQKRLPIGGHHFNAYGATFTGETFHEVVSKLAEFKRNNNIAAGNPEQEVLMFYFKNWPYMVKMSEKPQPFEPKGDYDYWRDWIFATWKKPPSKFITSAEAKERWDVCRNCGFLKKLNWPETKESTELARRAFILSRGMTSPDFLGYCSLHKAHLPALVFVDNPAPFSAKKEGDEPSECWVV